MRDPETRQFRVNYDPKIRETLHEAEYLMKMNLDVGPLALNFCLNEDHFKTTNDSWAFIVLRDVWLTNEIHCELSKNVRFLNCVERRFYGNKNKSTVQA